MDPTCRGWVGLEQFVIILSTITMGDIKDRISLVFQMLDLDNDGFLSKDDTMAVLLHIPYIHEKPHNSTFVSQNNLMHTKAYASKTAKKHMTLLVTKQI
jgi:Ca2+-binding EF-hand superfamily protein